MRRSVWLPVLLGFSLPLLSTTGARAQADGTVRGRVVEVGTGAPVEGTEVELRGTPFRTLTDGRGVFAFDSVPAGSYLLELAHRGFERDVDVLRVGEAEAVELEVRLTPGADGLAPFTLVVVSRRSLEDRSRGTRRNVVTREEIDAMVGRARHVGDVLQAHVTGISVEENAVAGGRFCLEFRRPASLSTPTACHPPAVVVDGIPVSDPLGYLNGVVIQQIQSLEVLPAVEAGTRYGSHAQNGVILVQTRRSRVARGPRVSPPRTAWDWDRESASHPWRRAFAGSSVGIAAAIGVVLAASGDCSPLNRERALQCGDESALLVSLAGFGLPMLAAAAGANLLGRTESSRGDLLRTVFLTGLPMLLGTVLATPRDGRAPSDEAAAFGGFIILVGVPAVATLGDHFFRRAEPAGDDPGAGSGPR